MKEIKSYYKACEGIRTLFLKTYFKEGFEDGYFDYHYSSGWIREDIGGILVISDFYFGIQDMVMLLEKKVSEDEMFKWYDWSLEMYNKKGYMNLEHYLMSNLYKCTLTTQK